MSKIRKINIDVTAFPTVMSSVYSVKEADEVGHPDFPAYYVHPEEIVETRLINPDDPKDPINFESVMIRTSKAIEFKEVSIKKTTGPRKVDDLILSEEETLNTVRHLTKKSTDKAREESKKLKKALDKLEKLEKLWEEKDNLDFDKPGEPILFTFEEE